MPIRVRADSQWNVPEPELTLVVNAALEIVGYCVGNDVSSRDIEGANPLYLPQAKVYDGSCALGPGILLAEVDALRNLPIRMTIARDGSEVFAGDTSTSQMRRSFEELVACLGRELAFPQGAFLMTGTGVVPPPDFSMRAGDHVCITIGPLTLENTVGSQPARQEP
jgi:2-dehydro-3-deoxy-D-arabinonate dehydratase